MCLGLRPEVVCAFGEFRLGGRSSVGVWDGGGGEEVCW